MLGLALGLPLLRFASGRALEDASARRTACFEQSELDPWRCVELGRSRLARLSPFTREQALTNEARARYEAASLAARIAGRVELDIARRDHEVARLLQLPRSEGWPMLNSPAKIVALAGALRFIPELVIGSDSDSPLDYSYAHAAAFHAGDFESVSSIMSSEARAADIHDPSRRAAWECLVHGPEHARSLLLGADPGHRLIATDAIIEACTGMTTPGLGWRLSPWQTARRLGKDAGARDWVDEHGEVVLWPPVLAQALLEAEVEPRAATQWINTTPALASAETLEPSERLRAYALGHVDYPRWSNPPAYDPLAMLRAARLLGRHVRAGDPPRADHALELAAGLLAAEAAAEWLDRRELELAREAAHEACQWLPASHTSWCIGPMILAGDEQAGLTRLAAQEPNIEHGELELRALVGLERWDQARTRAAYWRALAEAEGHRELAGIYEKWQAALAIAGDVLESGATQSSFTGWHRVSLDIELARFLGNPDNARLARWDWHFLPLDRARPDLDLVILARAAPRPELVEPWLDTHFAEQFTALGPRLFWARAQAARWRGDQLSYQLWLGRLTGIWELVDSEEDRLLLAAGAGETLTMASIRSLD
ncbi:MAG: hypothetical protein R6X02_24660 [Enhygromyxa sp.]